MSSIGAPAGQKGFRRGQVLLVMAAGFGWLAVGLLDAWNFTVDDTIIPFRYAENLSAGLGLVFNPGDRVEGFSSPLWTLMLAGFARLGWSRQGSDLALLMAAKLAGAVLAVATIALLGGFVMWLGRRREWGSRSELIGLAVLCTVATYSFPLWSMSGLETPLCALLVTLGLMLHFIAVSRLDAGRDARGLLVAGGVVFGVLTWVRPEQPFVWGLAFAVFLAISPKRVRLALLASIVPTLVLYAALEAWRWSYYGQWVPNSVIAKWGGGFLTIVLGSKYTLAGLGASIGFVSLGLCGLPALLRGRRDWQFLAVYCGAMILFIASAGGDWMPGYRLFVPVFPMLWVLAIAATLKLLEGGVGAGIPRAVIVGMVSVFALAAFASGRSLARAEYPMATGLKGIRWHSSSERIALAHEIGRIVPAGSVLALFEAGYVPYLCPQLKIMDNSGLNDRQIARLPGRHMYKLTADHFLSRKPDYYLAVMTRGTNPTADWLTLVNDPRFAAQYEIVSRSDRSANTFATTAVRGELANEERIGYLLYRRIR